MPPSYNPVLLDRQRAEAREALASLWRDGLLSRQAAYRGAIRHLDRYPLALDGLTPAMCVRLQGWVAEQRRLLAKPQPPMPRPTGCAHVERLFDANTGQWTCPCGRRFTTR